MSYPKIASEECDMSKIGYDFRDAGAHWHESMIKGKSFHRGSHYHLLDDLTTVLSEGDHIHEIPEESVGVPGHLKGGEHAHKVLLADGTVGMTSMTPSTPETAGKAINGQHMHEYTPDSDISKGGQHIHAIQMPDGTTRKTLGHDQIKVLIAKGEKLPQSLFDGVL